MESILSGLIPSSVCSRLEVTIMEVTGTGATRRLSMISFRPQNDVKKVGPPTFQAIPCFPCSKKSVPQHTFSNPQNYQNSPIKTEIRTLTCDPLSRTKIQKMIFLSDCVPYFDYCFLGQDLTWFVT